jgi:hypothetical protein
MLNSSMPGPWVVTHWRAPPEMPPRAKSHMFVDRFTRASGTDSREVSDSPLPYAAPYLSGKEGKTYQTSPLSSGSKNIACRTYP